MMRQTQDVSILIGTPLIGNPTPRFTASLVSLIKPARCQWSYVHNRNCDVARNELVERCLDQGWDWLFMVDADMRFEPETLMRLNGRGQPLIAGLCFTRVLPPAPAAYRGQTTIDEDGWPRYRVRLTETLDWVERNQRYLDVEHPSVILPDQPGALMEYDSTGGACVLIHREILAKMEPPWFKYTHPDRMVGEDFYFYQKCRELGYQLLIDRTVIVGHQYGDQYIGPVDFATWMLALQYYKMPDFPKYLAKYMQKLGIG